MPRLAAALFFLLSVPLAAAAGDQVGISPPHLDLGTILPGTQKIASIALTSTAEEEFLVTVPVEPATTDFYAVASREHLFVNASEEPITDWLQVLENPAILAPLPESLQVGSGIVNSAASINLVLRVPPNAEPGHHVVYVHPIPRRAPELGSGAAILATVRIPVFFVVPGPAIRSGQVLDIVAQPPTENGVPLVTYFKNTGTVTISARAQELIIRNENGAVWSGGSTIEYAKPGEVVQLWTYVPPGILSHGTYDTSVNVTYGTGSAALNTGLFLDVTARLISVPPAGTEPPPLPVLTFVLVIIAGAVWYARRQGRAIYT